VKAWRPGRTTRLWGDTLLESSAKVVSGFEGAEGLVERVQGVDAERVGISPEVEQGLEGQSPRR